MNQFLGWKCYDDIHKLYKDEDSDHWILTYTDYHITSQPEQIVLSGVNPATDKPWNEEFTDYISGKNTGYSIYGFMDITKKNFYARLQQQQDKVEQQIKADQINPSSVFILESYNTNNRVYFPDTNTENIFDKTIKYNNFHWIVNASDTWGINKMKMNIVTEFDQDYENILTSTKNL